MGLGWRFLHLFFSFEIAFSYFGRIWPKYSNHPVRWRWEWRFLQGRHRIQIGRGSALFCVSLSAKNRMVQAPKSWYNRYKSYGALGPKSVCENATIPGNCPGKICDIVSYYSGAASSPALYDSVPLCASPEPYNSVPARSPAFPR